MIGCSFVANRDYFGELGLLDSGMDVYGGENIELGIRVCVSPSFLLFLLPFYPCRFKWSSGHRSVAPLINEAPLGVLEDQPCVCSSQQGNGDKQVTWSEKVGSLLLYILRDGESIVVLQSIWGFFLPKSRGKKIEHFPKCISVSMVTVRKVYFQFCRWISKVI